MIAFEVQMFGIPLWCSNVSSLKTARVLYKPFSRYGQKLSLKLFIYWQYSRKGYSKLKPTTTTAKRCCRIAALINLSKSSCARSNQFEAVGIGISNDFKPRSTSAANLSILSGRTVFFWMMFQVTRNIYLHLKLKCLYRIVF